MSVDKTVSIADIFKVIMYIMMTVCGFLLVDSYNTLKDNQREMKEDQRELVKTTNEIQSKVIRIEYELKLK